jgi:hypothetical protein
MKQYKSDGRYKYHNQGFHYIVDFRWGSHEDSLLFTKLLKVFGEMYGPVKEKTLNENSYPVWKLNPDWRFEQVRSARRKRIYLKEESGLSMALLRVG